MKIVTTREELRAWTQATQRRSVVTTGVFDGLHLGHQELLRAHAEEAARLGLARLVVTFSNHPLSVLAPPYCPPRILSEDRKHTLLARTGVEVVASLEFTPEFAAMSPEDYVAEFLAGDCAASAVVAGYDFRFGAKGRGDVAMLREQAAAHNIELRVVDAVSNRNVLVKSTMIRDFLMQGDVARAAALLTRPFELRGVVVRGQARGRTIGFPTANLETTPGDVVPARGVYVCWAAIDDAAPLRPCMMNIGFNPTFGLERISIEAHLLDFDGELPGRMLSLFFVERLREEQKFENVEALVQQLERDRTSAHKILAGPDAIAAAEKAAPLLAR